MSGMKQAQHRATHVNHQVFWILELCPLHDNQVYCLVNAPDAPRRGDIVNVQPAFDPFRAQVRWDSCAPNCDLTAAIWGGLALQCEHAGLGALKILDTRDLADMEADLLKLRR